MSNSTGAKQLETYMNEFNSFGHERLQKGFKLGANACVTFLEIAKDTFINYFEGDFIELRDMVLISPLTGDNGKPLEVRTVIKNENGCMAFIISSREDSGGQRKDSGWVRHAKGLMCRFAVDKIPECNMKEVKKRCAKGAKDLSMDSLLSIQGLNMLMDLKGAAYIGENEAYLDFEMSAEAVDVLKENILHPCTLDLIVNEAVKCIAGEGGEVFSYKSLKVYGGICPHILVHIMDKGIVNVEEGKRRRCFDIKLTDESGCLLADVENYTVLYRESGSNKSCKTNSEGVDDINCSKSIGSDGKSLPDGNPKPPEKPRPNNDYWSYASGLTWRQMNCLERNVALMLGSNNNMPINCFKFMVGAKKGYDLAEYGLDDSGDWTETYLHNRILNKMGYAIKIDCISDSENLHKTISSYIDSGRAVCIKLDEYHLHYSRFYLKSHTGHSCIVTGYDSERKVYGIIDHNHLKINSDSLLVDYGPFFCTFKTLENIYSDLANDRKLIISLDRLNNEPQREDTELKRMVAGVLTYLIEKKQSGRDVEMVFKSVKQRDRSFDAGSVKPLHIQVGGKELLIDTFLSYLCKGWSNESLIRDLSFKIVSDSNKLLNNYVFSMYKGKEMPVETVEEYQKTIQKDTEKLFKEVLKYL